MFRAILLFMFWLADPVSAALDVYRTPDGLPHNFVTDIAQDHRGYIWIATRGGVTRFDGYEFFSPFKEQEFAAAAINQLLATRDGIWALSDGHVRYIDFSNSQLLSWNDEPVLALANHGEKTLALTSTGITRLEVQQDKVMARQLLTLSEPADFFACRNNFCWLVTKKVVSRWSFGATASDVIYRIDENFSVRKLRVTNTGEPVLIGSDKLLILDNNGGSRSCCETNSARAIWDVSIADNDDFWIASDQGIEWWQQGHLVWQSNNGRVSNDLPSVRIPSLLRDRNNNLWVGTFAGLLRMPSSYFEFNADELTHWTRLERNSIWGMTNWQGILVYAADKNGIKNYGSTTKIADSLLKNLNYQLQGVRVDYLKAWQNVLLVGTNRGLYLLNEEGDIHRALLDKSIKDISTEKDTLWVATTTGSFRLIRQEDKWIEQEILQENSWSITSDNHSVYVGTDKNGLWRITKDDLFTSFRYSSISISARVQALLIESDIELWVAQAGKGLLRINTQHDVLNEQLTKPSLSSETVYAIQKSDQGLWLASDGGLSFLNRKTGHVHNYYENDGLASLSVYGFGVLGDKLYAYGDGGINSIDQSKRLPRGEIGGLQLTLAQRNNRVQPRTINFLKSGDYLALNMRLLDWNNPAANELEISWDGESWQHWNSAETLRLINVAPPRLQIQARAKTRDGYIISEQIVLDMDVVPPWWQRRNWQATVVLLSFLAMYGIYRRRLKQEQVINHNLARIATFKTDFIARTSHELRTPVEGVIGLAESLRQTNEGKMDAASVHTLRLIEQSGHRLARVVEQLLDWSQLTQGTIELHMVDVSLRHLVKESLSFSAPFGTGKAISVVNRISEHHVVRADEQRLQQIITQILNNIFEESSYGSVLLQSREIDGHIELLVKHTGSGITRDAWQKELKKPLQKDIRQSAGKYSAKWLSISGLGLGLSLAAVLIEKMQGTLQLDDVDDEGADVIQVCLKLPVGKTVQADSMASEDSAMPATNDSIHPLLLQPTSAMILIVDDDATNRTVLASYMHLLGHQAQFARDGLEAIAMARQQTPDLVLMDVMMPNLDGLSATRRLREQFNLFELPILVVSARTEMHDVIAALEAGANDYIGKPVRSAELQARVQTLLTLRNVNILRKQRDQVAEHANTVMRLSVHRAQTDSLTGLPNRQQAIRRLSECVTQAQTRGDCIAVMMVAIDNFSSLNESLGHEAGDQFLKAVALRLRETVREHDMVARWGADQYLLIFNAIDRAAAANGVVQRLAKTVRQAVHHPVMIGSGEVERPSAIGVACFPNDGEHGRDLLRHVEVAVRYAKADGAGQLSYYRGDMDKMSAQRFALQTALGKAIRQNEITVHYQLKQDLANRDLIGAEALVRWQHPENGFISPAEFIPLAEASGLIIPLGHLVMRKACADFRQWLLAGLPVKQVAINVSVHQFKDPDLMNILDDCVQQNQLACHQVELEITESALSNDMDNSIQLLRQLRDKGFHLAIDDFGTGYSSLAYLRRFPITALKIDQSFVREIPQSDEDSAIVTAIIQLTRTLQLDVVAEGIETQAQWDFLREAGCHIGQGYFIARPCTSEQVIKQLSPEAKQA